MILYNKDWWGLLLITRAYGSAFPRVLPPMLLSGALTAGLVWSGVRDEVAAFWVHPYIYSIFAAILSFILVFRAQYGYARYWEARTQLQVLTARLMDAASLVMAFDRHTLPTGDEEALAASANFTGLVLHLCSLLHATCCQALRRDPNLGNLSLHGTKEPPTDPRELVRRPSYAHLATAGSVGRARLTDMFVLRGSARALAQFNAAQKLPVIGGISQAEWAALGCPADQGEETLAWPSSVKGRTKRFVRTVNTSCCVAHVTYMDRPHIVAAWLQELLVKRKMEGGLAVASPVLARSYQLLSEAMAGYEQCRKISDTPFPFPWAQFMIVVLLVFTLTFPLLVVAFVHSHILAVFLTTITVGTYWGSSEVAREIEDPFWNDPNSLPLANTQHMVNRLLLALAGSTRPASNMDATPLAYQRIAAATGLGGSGSATPFNPNPFAAPSSPSAAAAAGRRKEPSLLAVAVAGTHSAGAAAASRGPVSPAASPRWGAAPGRPQLPGLSALQVTVPAASSPAGATKGGLPFNHS